ncbi:epoxide hydrolase N-terminal domain-containing protein [Zhongshania aliphaticivorans]|uniref:epoxide hydrolase N-terminal domain-containing protein n=1 Tax=Zhongshania aliphaticivorans TaxID=1470434 RepID=UPI0012E5A331|nr:epoxide hydrolase N-terminal domain-containing protein [Zhongshania aliphaticivorans]CAA0091430.1 Uncharacterised protein [Zhongshania aliphaticivorans]
MNIEPFIINIDQAQLDDLASRLKNARIVPDFGNSNWEYGTNTAYLLPRRQQRIQSLL